jgi:hypothetical protein
LCPTYVLVCGTLSDWYRKTKAVHIAGVGMTPFGKSPAGWSNYYVKPRIRSDYSIREHAPILKAFLKRNPEPAESVVLSHMNNQMKTIKKKLQSEAGKYA